MMAVTKNNNTLTLSCEKQKDSEEFEDLTMFAKQVLVGTKAHGAQNSLVIVRADASEKPEKDALTDGADMALHILSGLPGPRVSKREWKAAVDAEYRKEHPDKTFMNWVKELVEAGDVKRVKRGFYEWKRPGSATASEVPISCHWQSGLILLPSATTPKGWHWQNGISRNGRKRNIEKRG